MLCRSAHVDVAVTQERGRLPYSKFDSTRNRACEQEPISIRTPQRTAPIHPVGVRQASAQRPQSALFADQPTAIRARV
jgi:hypothetical protein